MNVPLSTIVPSFTQEEDNTQFKTAPRPGYIQKCILIGQFICEFKQLPLFLLMACMETEHTVSF